MRASEHREHGHCHGPLGGQLELGFAPFPGPLADHADRLGGGTMPAPRALQSPGAHGLAGGQPLG